MSYCYNLKLMNTYDYMMRAYLIITINLINRFCKEYRALDITNDQSTVIRLKK